MNTELPTKVTRECGCSDDCCSSDSPPFTGGQGGVTADLHSIVREKYGEVAEKGTGCCGSGCCGVTMESLDDVAKAIGYFVSDLKNVPEGANLGLGCGNPIEYAKLQPGETVVDLGSGAGFDCFIAAHKVGPTGKVIGVDMTAQMLTRARDNAQKGSYPNVEFRLGQIEHLPVADSQADVIISNCVVNLSPDKPQVFREALRILKSGGRMLLSDLVLTKELSPALQNSVAAYVGCVSGASQKQDYLRMIAEAGFTNIEIVAEHSYEVGLDMINESIRTEAFAAVTSVKVRASKP
jgi:SAM-dependent methyltransferase